MAHYFRGFFPQEGNGNWFKKKIRATPGVISNPILLWNDIKTWFIVKSIMTFFISMAYNRPDDFPLWLYNFQLQSLIVELSYDWPGTIAHWAKLGGHVDLHTFGSKKLQKLWFLSQFSIILHRITDTNSYKI